MVIYDGAEPGEREQGVPADSSYSCPTFVLSPHPISSLNHFPMCDLAVGLSTSWQRVEEGGW